MSARWLSDWPLRINEKHAEGLRRGLVRILESIVGAISTSTGNDPPARFRLANHLPEKLGHALRRRAFPSLESPPPSIYTAIPLTGFRPIRRSARSHRSEEHTSELQSLRHLVCRLLL